jgi:hypothetical protein
MKKLNKKTQMKQLNQKNKLFFKKGLSIDNPFFYGFHSLW